MRRAPRVWRVIPLLVVVGFSACDSIFGEDSVCTLIPVHALEVHLEDAMTDLPVADSEARAFVVDGSFVHELERMGSAFFGPYERPGRYTVNVVSPGYDPWVREGVRVRADDCHVETVRLTARLEPTE